MNILRLAWSSYQTESSLKQEQHYLRELGHSYRRVEPNGPIPDKLSAYDVLIINSQFNVDESFLKLWKNGLILTASNGYDHIDLETAQDLGIDLARTPEARAEVVVEHTFTFMDALLRDLHRSGMSIRQNEWLRPEAHENIRRIQTVTLGVLGYGNIGKKVTSRALQRDVGELIIYDPLEKSKGDLPGEAQFVTFRELIDQSDILTLHADLNPTSSKLIDRDVLDHLGNDSYLINTARGNMIELEDLFDHIKSGELGGAALDVFPAEPPEEKTWPDTGLLTSPHSGGFRPGLLERLRKEIGETIESYEKNSQLKHPIRAYSEEELNWLRPEWDA